MSYTFGTCFEATSSGVRKTEGPGLAVEGPDVHFLLADGAYKSVCKENFNNNITYSLTAKETHEPNSRQ